MKLPKNPLAEIIEKIIWPIKTITVATPSTPTPVEGMVWITYDMMTSQIKQKKEGTLSSMSRIPDTYHHLLSCPTPQELQEWISEVGWALGAGYMYRWHHAPGRKSLHLWGLERYSVMGDDSAEGDTSPELAELCEKFGVWSWEINCAYGKQNGFTLDLMASWLKNDPSLQPDGSRLGNFPGWNGDHPWLQAVEPGTGYESRYQFAKPEKYNKNRDVLVNGLH